ncbi:MAG: MFS transporter [Candidatus Methanomethylophilaceae archaeon]|nr:MFS transporter [Candidatus Methanomethylophilaceae archaeon]
MAESLGKKTIACLMISIAFAALMDGLDGSIVNIALPTLAEYMNTDTGTIAWITVVYFIMMAGLLIFFGRIASNGAIKKIFAVGIAIFTISSLGCGISTSFHMLLIFRLVQGIGAAMMGAAVPMICVRFLPREKLGMGLGIMTLGGAMGYAMGPALGGIIIDALSWHWIFLINVPLGMIIIPLVLKMFPKDIISEKKHLDYFGASLLFMSIVFGILALDRSTYPEDSQIVIASTILFLICLITFIHVETKKKEPILNLRLFKHWKFDSVFMAYLLANLAYMGMFYLLPFYMNICMGFSASASGFWLFLPSLITLVFCIPISRWSDRTERRSFSVMACIFVTISCATMALMCRENAIIPLALTTITMGLYWTFCGGPMASRIVENVADESREMGSSLMNETFYLGGTIGTALFAMMFTMSAHSGNISFADITPDVFLNGFQFAAIIGTIICMIAVILSYIVDEKKT